MGQAKLGKPMMVFDWHKAADLINERNPKKVSAGLHGDWAWTGGLIYENNMPVNADDTYTFLSSTWATPEISIDGEIIDCFVMASETNGWCSDTYWPDSARERLGIQENKQ